MFDVERLMRPSYSSAYAPVEKTRASTKGQVSSMEKGVRMKTRQEPMETPGTLDETLQNSRVPSPITTANLRERRGASGGG